METENIDTPQRASAGPICLVANPKSGQNTRNLAAVQEAARILDAEICMSEGPGGLPGALARAKARNPRMIVSAGGDGTAMSLASGLVGTGIALGVLPMGTFNYFARGLGLSANPATAARQIRDGRTESKRIGMVNGQVFLNNASVGVYPWILKDREAIYRRFGRSRLMAHWSVMRSFLRFRGPMRIRLSIDDHSEERSTALVFVGRSAFQLQRFGLNGAHAIENGKFAVLVVRAATRSELFHRTARLAAGLIEEGVDYDLYASDRVALEPLDHRRLLLAYDGEKRRMAGPLRFTMSDDPLQLVIPDSPA